jgi:hypothetical protein
LISSKTARTLYGTDNSAMLAAMKAAGAAFRGVAVIGDGATGHDLEQMHAAGVRGARLNIVDLRDGKGQLPVERIKRLADRISPFGWHIEFLMPRRVRRRLGPPARRLLPRKQLRPRRQRPRLRRPLPPRQQLRPLQRQPSQQR